MILKVNRPSKERNSLSAVFPLPLQNRPKFADDLRFPDNLIQFPAEVISELHGKYTKLYVYANEERTKLIVKLLQLETKETQIRALVFRERPQINQQEKWRRDAVLEEDPRMRSLLHEISFTKIQKEWADTFVANFDRYLIALSRELSRRSNGRPI
jgi:hypothetical protein